MKSISSTVLALSMGLAAASAQTRPDFSGTWSMDMSRSDSAVQSEPVGPTTVTIAQTPTELTMTIARDGKSSTVVYRLDGAAAKIVDGTATSHWDGSSLVTEAVRTIHGQTVTTKEVRRLNPAGDEMRVESVLVVQHGYTLKGSQNYGAGIDVFTRVK